MKRMKTKGGNGPCVRGRQHGFSLIELMVVVVIIGVLAALVAPRFFGKVEKSKLKAAQAQIELFGLGLDHYSLDLGTYPTTSEGLKALRERPAGKERWDGPYLKKELPRDPWGNDYVYTSPGSHGDYDIVSYGADGGQGGEGNDQDIVSWKGLN